MNKKQQYTFEKSNGLTTATNFTAWKQEQAEKAEQELLVQSNVEESVDTVPVEDIIQPILEEEIVQSNVEEVVELTPFEDIIQPVSDEVPYQDNIDEDVVQPSYNLEELPEYQEVTEPVIDIIQEKVLVPDGTEIVVDVPITVVQGIVEGAIEATAQQLEVVQEEVRKSKAQLAREIFKEEFDKAVAENRQMVRKDVLKRFTEEAGLSPAGKNTYYQNLREKYGLVTHK